jgi:hypothetical protein
MEMEYMQVISLINVVYVIKGLDGMETCVYHMHMSYSE